MYLMVRPMLSLYTLDVRKNKANIHYAYNKNRRLLLQNLPIGLFQLHALDSDALASKRPNLFFIYLCTFSYLLIRAKGHCVQCDNNHRIYMYSNTR